MYPSGLLLLLLGASFARGQRRNVTIDDGIGDADTGAIPVYRGAVLWNVRKGPDCPDCWLRPDAHKMFNETWHDSTIDYGEAEIRFSFKGTDLFVFCTLAGLHPDTITDTHLELFIDDESVDAFDWSPIASSPDFQYQYQVLEAKDLENKDHTARVVSHEAMVHGQRAKSLIIFDYALYTTEAIPTSNSTPSGTTAASTSPSSTTEGSPSLSSPTTPHTSSESTRTLAVGIACGFVALLLSIGALVLFLRIRRLRRRRHDQHQIQLDNVNQNWPPRSYPLPKSASPPMVVPLDPGSDLSLLPPDLGPPAVASLGNHKLDLRAGLVNEKPTRTNRDDAPPSYS